MIRLALTLSRAGGWPRMLLLGSCTAVVCTLLLIVVTFARLPNSPDEVLFNLVADPGTRVGTAFATVLLTLPPLLLLYQAVRLGAAARDRRLAALRLAGATPADVRRLGVLEVGIPALAGSIAGVALYWLLRQVLGDNATHDVQFESDGYVSTYSLRLVPTSVAPQWWEALLVVLGTTVVAIAVGARASRGVVVTPLGVSRRQASAPPRPWGLLLLVAAVLMLPVAGTADSSEAVPLAIVGLAVIGVLSLASWAAYRTGRFTESRTSSAAVLLAARRLVADSRPAGRAAAAVGAIALVAGGGASLAADLLVTENDDPYYYISLGLVAAALLVALLVAIGTLAVHSVESQLDRKRSVASLAALGMSLDELESAQRWEARLVAMPIATFGVLLGSATLVPLGQLSPVALLVLLADVVIVLGLVWLAIIAAVRITRPWAVSAASAANLRTE
jgi:hypothetical protein